MVVSVSFVLLLAVIIFFLIRSGLKWSHAIICAAFGFWLSATTVAPSITAGGQSLANLLASIRL